MIKKNKSQKRKAFSLVEVVVSLFIFTIIMLAASQIFTQTFSSYHYTRNLQRDIENAQFIMAILSKELRTSTIVYPNTPTNRISEVQFFDHSQQLCLRYRIFGTEIQVASASMTTASACNGTTFVSGDFTVVSTGTVSGEFDVTPSAGGPTRTVGKVTMALLIMDGTHKASIQSTVSLRDYGADGSDL